MPFLLTCPQARPKIAPAVGASPQLGRVFDHYRLLEKLGEGGMGVVWLAEDTRLARKVALKFLPPEALRDAIRRQRFEQEARAAAALSHPGIATVHELAETEGQTYIVFEYVPGSTLRSLVVPGGLQRDELLEIAGDIAEALAAAHSAGVVHRDLKPENVMRAPTGACKVLDFGLARFSAQAAPDSATQSYLTGAGMVVGTVGYMAPEQLEGKEVDFRCDIFSFGTLVYELATGVHPFQSGNSASTIAAIMTAEPPPLTQRNLLQPAELERIVRKCLRKRRAERYQSTSDLAVDLATLKHDSDERPSSVAAVAAAVAPPQGRRWWWVWQLSAILVFFPSGVMVMMGALPAFPPMVWRPMFFLALFSVALNVSLRVALVLAGLASPESLPRLVVQLRNWLRASGWIAIAGLVLSAMAMLDSDAWGAVAAGALAAGGVVSVIFFEPALEQSAFPSSSEIPAVAPSQRPSKLRRWWWWSNLVACCVGAPLWVCLAWLGWHEAGVFWGKSVFVAVVIGVGLNVAARVTFLVFAFVELPDFALYLRRYGVWLRIGMFIVAAGLGILAVPLSEAHVGLAATLAALAIVGVAGSEFVEPAMARGAFPETGNQNARNI